MKKKVLLIGSAGMAGQVIKNELLNYSDFIEVLDIARNSNISVPSFLLDITNFSEVENIILSGNFDYIINCVGILNKSAEENPDLAILINSYFPHFLESLTSKLNTKIIHISTDCVFSGTKGGYIESDFRDGKGFYAQSKALGELWNDKDLTIRTSIIGPDKNFNGIGLFNWFVKQKGQVNGFANAFWSGVTTVQLAEVILKIILGEINFAGLVHLTNNSKISKFQLLNLIKEVFQLDGIEVKECKDYRVDKSFLNSNLELLNLSISYKEMIVEMYEWMKLNHYNY